jgi:hypothetical protein
MMFYQERTIDKPATHWLCRCSAMLVRARYAQLSARSGDYWQTQLMRSIHAISSASSGSVIVR